FERLEGPDDTAAERLAGALRAGHCAAWLAEDPAGRAVGYALTFPTFSTFLARRGLYLEDLFVTPEARGTGLGRALFATVAAHAAESGAGRLEWTVLDWNDPARRFYASRGARELPEWRLCRLDGPALRAFARPG
ncbi:MAG TPA: GNAT family N-acetyltransferase, partial [Deinococcales bacterium]|nr:GNAT family N-acetyltransferase [Deinococcales bacterium]